MFKLLSFLNPKIIIGIAVAIVVALGLFYIWNTQNRLEEYAKQEEYFERELEQRDVIIDNLREDVKDIRDINDRLLERERSFQRSIDRLNERLSNLSESARENPGETQDFVNREEAYQNRCIEIASGDTPKESDSENFVCPDLIEERSNDD